MSFSDDRIPEAKKSPVLAIAQRLGAKLSKAGATEYEGPCPVCGGTDRFSINTKENIFNCRGAEGGDVIKMVRHCLGLDFDGALEFLTGRARVSRASRAERYDHAPADDDAPPWGDDTLPAGRDPKQLEREAIKAGPVREYWYTDDMENRLFQIARYEWKGIDGSRQKSFRARRLPRGGDAPDKIKHGWVWSIEDDLIAPYRFPEVCDAIHNGEIVFFSEGEKDADTFAEWGLCGTTFPMAGKRMPADLSVFKDADIIIPQDNDPQSFDKHGNPRFHKNGAPVIPGKDFVQKIGRALHGIAKRIRVLEFRDIRLKGDVTDWRDEYGGTAELLFDRINATAKEWRSEKPVSKFGAIGWTELDSMGPSIDWLVDDLFTTGDKSIVAGPSQSGKSFFTIDMSIAIARGVPFLGKKVKPGLVLYQAGESGRGILGRAKAYRKHFDIGHDAPIPFQFLTRRVDLFSENGDVVAFIDECKAWQDYYLDDPLRLIVIDTLAKASVGADENSAKEMGIVLDNIDKINAATGAAVILAHHMNMDGKKLRGSTAIFSNVEQVIGISLNEASMVRTAKVLKMKDGSANEELKFEWLAVEIGRREDDGKPITSCVVLPVGEKQAVKAEERRKGFELWRMEELPFRAFMSALAAHGEPPQSTLQTTAKRVIHYAKWREEFAKITNISRDDGDDRAFAKKLDAALGKAGERLMKFKIIDRMNPYLWLTGKAVRGYPDTFPPAGESYVDRTESQSGASDDDLYKELFDGK